MESQKNRLRDLKSTRDSSGDRRAGSVGERPELAGSRDNDERSAKSKRVHSTVDDEVPGAGPTLDE
jgi:hypothetical protein